MEADFEEDRQLSTQNRIAQWSHMTNNSLIRVIFLYRPANEQFW